MTDREHLAQTLRTLETVHHRERTLGWRDRDEVTVRMTAAAIDRIKRQMRTPIIEQVLGE
jgi:hypothetical protein